VQSKEEAEKISVEYNPKEGLYTHYNFETIYPEYILIVEPVIQSTIVKDEEGNQINYAEFL